MARIRSIKPELWLSPQVMNLCHGARLLFIGLITQADDDGRGRADLRRLKAAVFPGDDCSASDIGRWLEECTEQQLVVRYSTEGYGDLYYLTGWRQHQSISKCKPSQYPPPPGTGQDEDRNDIGDVPDESFSLGKDGKGKEGGEQSSGTVPGLDLAAWERWQEYRTKIRKPLKPVSMPAAQRELAAFGSNQAAVVEQSVAAGWTGLFELKQRSRNGNGVASTAPEPSAASKAWDLLVSSGSTNGDARASRAAAAIGGAERLRKVSTFEFPKLRLEFCAAYDRAAA